MGVSDYSNNPDDTSKSYPAELYKLDPSSDTSTFSKLSKDDSVIIEEHDEQHCWEKDDIDEPDFGIEMAKAPAVKPFIRSISLPAKDMRSKMMIAEEKRRHGKLDVEKKPTVDENQSNPPLLEKRTSTHHDYVTFSKKTLNIDFPEGNRPDRKHKSNRSSEKSKGLTLGSVNEDIIEVEEEDNELNRVQTNASEENKGKSVWFAENSEMMTCLRNRCVR